MIRGGAGGGRREEGGRRKGGGGGAAAVGRWVGMSFPGWPVGGVAPPPVSLSSGKISAADRFGCSVLVNHPRRSVDLIGVSRLLLISSHLHPVISFACYVQPSVKRTPVTFWLSACVCVSLSVCVCVCVCLRNIDINRSLLHSFRGYFTFISFD